MSALPLPHVSPAQPFPRLSAEVVADDAIRSLLQRSEHDELIDRLAALEGEVNLLRQRDRQLSRSIARIDDEQRLAALIQQDFLPKSLPQVGKIRFATIFRPAGYVSGDLYDVSRLDETHCGVYLVDAVGHGMPAALLTMFLRNALVTKQISNGTYRLLDPNETMQKLNEALRSQNLARSSFATAIYARINCATAEVCFARGGHPPPILIDADGTVRTVEVEGGLLGVFDDESWPTQCITLRPGERMMFYTDGIEHAFNTDEQVGGERWKEELTRRAKDDTRAILSDFARAIDQRVGENVVKDDLTIVMAEHVQ